MKKLYHQGIAFLRHEQTRMCFYATGIFGLIAYLYLLVNQINNNDMIAVMPFGWGCGITSGRWMLHYLNLLTNYLWGSYNIPIFNGLLSILLLALTSAVLVRVLEIQNKWSAFALAAITATIAPIGSILFFLFTSHFYMLALLGMALSAWLLKKKGALSFAFAVVLAGCSLGIYQAYFPFLAVTLLLELLRQSICEAKPRKVLTSALKYAAALILSYVFYYLVLQFLSAALSQTVSDYQGMSSMGSVGLSSIPKAYYHFFFLFTHNYAGFNATGVIRVVILLALVCSALMVAVLWRRNKISGLFATIIFLLLPLAANAFLVIAPKSVMYTRMTMGLIALFYCPVVLAERFEKGKAIRVFICALLLLSSLNYAWQSNGNYMWVSYANEKASNYFTTLYTRAKSLDGYNEKMQIVFVGETFQDESYHDNFYGTPFLYGGTTGALGQINQYSRNSFIRNYLGYSHRQITPQERERYADLIAQMDSYPNDGSLIIVDDLVLVKLEE